MYDSRLKVLADNIVGYSVNCQKGEKVLINAVGVDYVFVNLLVNAVYEKGGIPFVNLEDQRILREIINNGNEEVFKAHAKHMTTLMSDMDCFIGVRGGGNTFELSDVDSAKMRDYNALFSKPVHMDIRLPHTKWVVLRYPSEGMSLQASMSTKAFENFYFQVCNLDYGKMELATRPLVALMNRTDKVRIVAKGTDISFSIKGIPAVPCVGTMNLPDGEVYTAPVKDSVNGRISYNTPSMREGVKFENVVLDFENGKIVNATANYTDRINEIFDTDEGARYVGEFALGINPYVTKPMGEILFDEKISGSIHFTPGNSYDDAPNGNHSAVHWDLVQIQTPEYGGGEIYFDDVLIRKDGLFVLDELKCLNPDNLK